MNDPDEVRHAPPEGETPLGRSVAHFVRVIHAFLGSIPTLDGHGGLWKVLRSRFFGSGDKNIA